MGSTIDYDGWKQEYRPVLESFREKSVKDLFSGGKDSSLALHLMSKASKEFGFDFEAHVGAFPVHRYPEKDRERIHSYWRERGVEVTWHDPGKTDDFIENEPNPCLPCQKLRKQMLSTISGTVVGDWKSLVLVTSYTLWDIVSYTIEHILNLPVSDSVSAEARKRYLETAQRFYPVLEMKEGYTVFRPLVKCNADDIKKTVEEAGIPTLLTPCKFAEFRPKRMLQRYYQKETLRFDYDKVLDFAKKSLSLPDSSFFSSIGREEYLQSLF